MQEAMTQVIILYLFFAVIVTTLFWLIRKVLKNKFIAFVYIVILISPAFLYIPVELNTYLYGKEFKDVEFDTGFNNPVMYYKVFSISETEAELFYVEGENGNHNMGNFYRFTKENGKWKYNERGKTIWTNLGGSASEFTVPPYF